MLVQEAGEILENLFDVTAGQPFSRHSKRSAAAPAMMGAAWLVPEAGGKPGGGNWRGLDWVNSCFGARQP